MGKSPNPGGGSGGSSGDDSDSDPHQTEIDDHGTSQSDESDGKSVPPPTPPAGAGEGISSGLAGVGAAVGAGAGVGIGDGAGEEVRESEERDEEPAQDSSETDESQNETEQENQDEGEESDDTEEDDEDEDEDEDEQDVEADFVVYTDPWDTTGWGNEPDLRRLEEEFGDNLTISYAPLPPRRVEKWDTDHSMPAITNPDLPDDTTTSSKALMAAMNQDLYRPFLRRLRISALSEGKDIEDQELLARLASEVGLDPGRLERDMANIQVDDPVVIQETPQIEATIDDIPHYWSENVEYGRVRGRLLGEGVNPQPKRSSLREFVKDSEPVSTEEVKETYQLGNDEAEEMLEQTNGISSIRRGLGSFWIAD